MACTSTIQSPSTPNNLPTPTLHPLFGPAESTLPPQVTAELQPPTLASAPPTLIPTQIITITIFDDTLNSSWQLLDTEGMTGDLASTDEVHTGRYSIAMTPSEDLSTLYFAVRSDAKDIYPQDQVLTLSFWLNGGNDFIAPEDLAVAIIGSNDYPYWVEGDKSVYIDEEFPFSETRLYFLDINNSIPEHTWVQVIVTLDELIFDPAYNYVTGFYLKNNEGFYNTVYIDDIELSVFESDTTGQ